MNFQTTVQLVLVWIVANKGNMTEKVYIDKIIWDREKKHGMNDCLSKSKHVFESIVDDFLSDIISTNDCIESMSELMLNVCKENFNCKKK